MSSPFIAAYLKKFGAHPQIPAYCQEEDKSFVSNHDEAKCEEESMTGAQSKAVPALVFIVYDWVDAVVECHGEGEHAQVLESEDNLTVTPDLYYRIIVGSRNHSL